jgi:NAD(P)-dependent dehydrogenase (short-subunit alcohol dehydrogenase family)
VTRFFAAIGPFDHLILGLSGGGGGGPFAQLDLRQLRQGFDAKFWAYFSTFQAALPTLRSTGSATLVTAGSAHSAIPATAGLASINGALEAMIRLLGSRARAAADQCGLSRDHRHSLVEHHVHRAAGCHLRSGGGHTSHRRLGTPEDVAEAIVFVATNGFMTGTIIECEGGGRVPLPAR